METQEWVNQQVAKLIDQSTDFQEQSFYQALQDTLTEQFKRIEQLQGEVDGRMWNVGKW
ncbi:hypothetical protein LOOC260_101440 [Paucilactobacillus hokkaidonensis JCM 18461]|uniref:Uncharacterized protein n=2 Tax=Paucilactobacillus hokkaidonensis TaxID=1193095 RepID=A0A0A1GR09_9LACO|nr:hypothetical protein [Paucilactobacillus hokkaidonensis]KRO09834.1 hypothetical protein IV59_GL000302 [Paucilactobacillus hokkaidonensis]BAP84722.1 hypothetical protein LOOC260_101440 [Paucilactobacillus hokkaidonensis JCM 18461]